MNELLLDWTDCLSIGSPVVKRRAYADPPELRIMWASPSVRPN